ncbi:AAA family ATPase [Kribbella sp.]|uniref:AAA family ATPase n=1 Tax=Kribbella sp. TaxID=1871183 RepID=UPI002D2695AB|nr:AAA family ATPase [Kribbella sp.]HZX04990.1 AAA family ATPase [Kribbella sp.]
MPSLLLILTGLPYSGKTTLARALETRGAAIVELDHINRERGFRIEDGVPVAEWPETIRQAEVLIEEHVKSGREVVVLSWVNPTHRDRQRWQDFASARGLRHEVVYVAAEQSLLTTRRTVGGPDRHDLSDDVIQRVQRRFQPPTEATTVQASWTTQRQLDAVTAGWSGCD